jgi:pimeloyl-ACP methyl ester carboxylesterase
MASVQVNGITIEYEEQGVGDPVLLIMGLGGQLVDWPPELIDAIAAQGFRVIRFDNRDIGLSTEFDHVEPPTRRDLAKAVLARRDLDAPYLLGDMADDAMGLLDALGVESAHVVGMSMGGMIAQQTAIDHRSRVRSLVSIMSTTGSRRVGRPTAKVARMALRQRGTDLDAALEQSVEFFAEVSGPRFDPEAFRETARAGLRRSFRPDGTARQFSAIVASGDRTEALRRLDVPTLVVHGLADTLVRPSGGVATADAIPGSRLLMFNDMGHDFPDTRHGEIATAVRLNADRATIDARAAAFADA